MREALRPHFGDSRDDHTGVGVAHEDDIVQSLVLHQPGHVLNVEFEVDLGLVHKFGEVRPLAQSA